MDYFNKNLDEIGLSIIEPCDDLRPYIHSYWVVKKQNLEKPVTNKILSDGNSGIMINFSNPYTIKISGVLTQCNDTFTFTGPTKHPIYITFKNTLDTIGIRFNAAGVYTFFGSEIFLYKDTVFGLNNNQFKEIDGLYAQLHTAISIKDKISYIELFLLNKIKNNRKKNAVWIFDFVDSILAKKGNINIEELCHDFNISKRSCERKFKKEIGFSPKEYSRIIRIQNAKNSISPLNTTSLASISYDNGFFDQSHFIREFKFFMNETPKDYFIKKQNMIKPYKL